MIAVIVSCFDLFYYNFLAVDDVDSGREGGELISADNIHSAPLQVVDFDYIIGIDF